MRRQATTYSGVHQKLHRERGPATDYTCSCGAPARQWAYLRGDPDERTNAFGVKFSLDLAYYRPMCRRCHAVYDKSIITHCPQGHEYTPENTLMDAGKRKCKTCHYTRKKHRKLTPEQHARRIELQRERRAQRTPEQYAREQARETELQRVRRGAPREASS